MTPNQLVLRMFRIVSFFFALFWSTTALFAGAVVTSFSVEVAEVEVDYQVFTPENPPAMVPMILISHGLGGGRWDHHLLARNLVDAGFAVLMVAHPDDLLRLGDMRHFALRTHEVKAAFEDAKTRDLGFKIDENRIGAFGFSLGGATVMALLGGELSRDKVAAHCAHAAQDPFYCRGLPGGKRHPFPLKIARGLYKWPKSVPPSVARLPLIKVAAFAAPAGQPFSSLERVTADLFIIRATRDEILRYPFHSENLHQLLSQKHRYQTEDVHHISFYRPFPHESGLVIHMADPAPLGFNQKAFLNRINSEIAEFFREKLK
ncbi:MAG: alpha/beta hydrolase family protein [Halocynthiibacter sp.]